MHEYAVYSQRNGAPTGEGAAAAAAAAAQAEQQQQEGGAGGQMLLVAHQLRTMLQRTLAARTRALLGC